MTICRVFRPWSLIFLSKACSTTLEIIRIEVLRTQKVTRNGISISEMLNTYPEESKRKVETVVTLSISMASWNLVLILLERYKPTIRNVTCHANKRTIRINKFLILTREERNCSMGTELEDSMEASRLVMAKENTIAAMSNTLLNFIKNCLRKAGISFSDEGSGSKNIRVQGTGSKKQFAVDGLQGKQVRI